MKRISTGLAVAALLLAGCSTADDETTGATTPAASETAGGETQTEAAAPQSTADGFVAKQVNEDARAGCTTEDPADCDVIFRVTELQRGYECSTPATPLSGGPMPDGYETLLIRIEAEMADSFDFDTSDNVLHSQHYGVMDGDGYYIQSPDLMFCQDLDSDLNRLFPGTKARGAQLLAIPEGTETFRLGMLSGTGGWEWEIPS